MARLIRVKAQGPIRLEPQKHAVWLCQCGLSQNKPYCDGSHVQTRQETPSGLYVYNNTTQQPILKVADDKNIVSLFRSKPALEEKKVRAASDATTIFTDPPASISIKKFGQDSSCFDDVKLIRDAVSNGNDQTVDEFDVNADLYVMYLGNKPAATMRVNQARRGLMDCENYYPSGFISEFRPFVGSASRFAKHPSVATSVHLMHLFVREVWRDQLGGGMRVDIINVHQPMIPYYLRLGYELLCDSFFIHPRVGTPSFVMVLFADSRTRSPVSDVFADFDKEGFVEKAMRNLPLCRDKSCSSQMTRVSPTAQSVTCKRSRSTSQLEPI